MPRSSTSKDQDSPQEGTALAESTTTADQSGALQQAGPPAAGSVAGGASGSEALPRPKGGEQAERGDAPASGTTAPSALTRSDVPGPDDVQVPKGGVEALRERLGTDLNEYGAELARRVLGELHIHRNGGVPASQIALEAADQLEGGDAEYWNSTGQELAQKDFVGLNQRGSFFAPLPQQPTPQEQAQAQPQDGAQRSQEQGARSPQAPPLPGTPAPADQQAAP